MKTRHHHLLTLFPAYFGLQVYLKGWDAFAFSWDGLTTILWVLGFMAALFLGLPLLTNLLAKLFGASEPLLALNREGATERPLQWWHYLVWPTTILAIMVIAPPWESVQGWYGALTLGATMLALALLWFVYDNYIRNFVFGDVLFSSKDNNADQPRTRP